MDDCADTGSRIDLVEEAYHAIRKNVTTEFVNQEPIVSGLKPVLSMFPTSRIACCTTYSKLGRNAYLLS